MRKTTRPILIASLLACVGLCLLSGVGAGRAPAPLPRKPPRHNAQQIVGVWRVIEAGASGKHYGHETTVGQIWVISPTKITIHYPDQQKDEFECQLGDGTQRVYTLTPAEGNVTRLTFRAVYKIEQGKLHYCRTTSSLPPSLEEREWESRGERRFTLVPETNRR